MPFLYCVRAAKTCISTKHWVQALKKAKKLIFWFFSIFFHFLEGCDQIPWFWGVLGCLLHIWEIHMGFFSGFFPIFQSEVFCTFPFLTLFDQKVDIWSKMTIVNGPLFTFFAKFEQRQGVFQCLFYTENAL